MPDMLLIKDIYQLIAYLERRQRETLELLATATSEKARLSLNGYINGLGESIEAARKVATYDPASLQTSFELALPDAEPLFNLKGQ